VRSDGSFDVSFALRFTVVAVLTLSAGVGANAAVF
jgi:hypothetical protein